MKVIYHTEDNKTLMTFPHKKKKKIYNRFIWETWLHRRTWSSNFHLRAIITPHNWSYKPLFSAFQGAVISILTVRIIVFL